MHDEQYVPHIMARNYDLFIMLPNIVKRRGSYFDIPDAFRVLTGMDIEDYIGLGFGLLTHYDTIDVKQIEEAGIAIQMGTYFKEAEVARFRSTKPGMSPAAQRSGR